MDEAKNLATSRAKAGALPDEIIHRLFQRFALRYGSMWLERWTHIPMPDVMEEWATELGKVDYVQLAGALRKCGKFPPSLPEFVELCDAEPRPYTGPPQLSVVDGEAVPMPERVRQQLAQFLGRHATKK